jgi:hypothetical protein
MGDSEHPLSPPNLTTEDDNNELLRRPRSASVQSRRSSWPLLPALQITTSTHSNNVHHNNVISPIIDDTETTSIPINSSSDSESSVSSEFGTSDKEKDTTYDVIHRDSNKLVKDQKDLNRRRSTLGGGTRKDSAGTLVEAALDQVEAQDRHVRFPEHIAEAGSLVERMLSTRRPSSNHHHHYHNTIEETAENDLNSLERQQTHQSHTKSNSSNNNNIGSGSVLASLMKLETQRRQPTIKRRKTIKRKKV